MVAVEEDEEDEEEEARRSWTDLKSSNPHPDRWAKNHL